MYAFTILISLVLVKIKIKYLFHGRKHFAHINKTLCTAIIFFYIIAQISMQGMIKKKNVDKIKLGV